MEEKILNGLEDLGYNGPCKDRDQFAACITDGPKNIEFTKLVHWLTNEMRALNNIDEEVNEISCPEDAVAFIMELTSFLKELNCPYTALTHGHVSDRLQTVEDRYLLLDYLVTELMGARILQEIKPDKKIELKIHETDEAAAMKNILMALRFSRPPPNITVVKIFEKINPAIESLVKKVSPDLLGTPIFCGKLSDKQWEILNEVERDLNNEYKIRREMLLTRLDVTVQSFEWSDKTRGKGDLIENIYSSKRRLLKADPNVDVSDLLAARDDIAIIEKTSSASVRKNTKSQLNKVIIGQVPDRGGRTNEIAPPPPEMPSWQQRSSGPMGGSGGFGGGGFGGRGGGNFQSNYNTGRQGYNQGGNYGTGNKPSNFGGFDSAGSFGSNRDVGNNFNRGSSSYSSDNKGRNFDSAGSYSSSYSRLANFDTSLNISKGSYDKNYSSNSSSYDNKSNYSSYDNKNNHSGYDNSKSNYSSQRDYEQSNKRAKTYDSFQTSRTTYADQYVQESERNKMYSNRGDDRNKSNRSYGRGGGHSYR